MTLFAIAYEIEAVGGYSQNIIRIQLAVGLPPAHYGAQCEAFTGYFTNRGAVKFEFRGRTYSIYVEKALCFPQSYAAASTILSSIRTIPKALILDLGGFTADYLRIQNGAGDLSVCDSLENGIISFYNKVISRISSDQDILLEESEIDAILEGKVEHVPPAVASAVEQQAQDFINDLFSTLRERGKNGGWCSKSGSYHSLIPSAAQAWGLNVEGCTASEPQRILDALSDGKLVVAIMTKGHFTSGGHFIVLRGVQDGQIMVADPASYRRSEKLWDLSIILNEASKRAGAGGPFWIIGL